MSGRDKWVRRFSVDETAKHKNGFTIYKITSVLFPIESPEAMTVVSVWKRYSDVQQLHKSMRSLHAGLHLRGTFPPLSRYSYFKRFHKEVIEERAKTIKTLLEFIAEHRLLFTSTEFVNFLQTGYPEPEAKPSGVINAIRSSLHLPIEETPPLEYQTSDDETRSPSHTARMAQTPANGNPHAIDTDELDFNISQIPIYEAADVEIRQSPTDKQLSKSDSFESINSLDSINSDLYDELSKVVVTESKPCVKSKLVLPDLINFDAPSTSKFEDYHTMPKNNNPDSDTVSLTSDAYSSVYDVDTHRSSSRVSLHSKRSVLSLSNVECKTKTEDSYVFEAGYMLNLATRCEAAQDYPRAFECYKSGIEKMLIGVQTDTDPQRRALIKEKTNKYLSYAEAIYKNHLCDVEQSLVPESEEKSLSRALHSPLPAAMLRRPYAELAQYRVLAARAATLVLALHRHQQKCYAIKVIQKIPNNLTEFDEYFLQRTNETKQPILPTNVPYMVSLQSYIETNNLIFLILTYAPGEKLFDYIKNYAKSIPNTPAREVNLENVFSEPRARNIEENDNIDSNTEYNNTEDTDISIVDRIEANIVNSNNNVMENFEIKTDDMENIEVSELVVNSQKLLLNVDKALSDAPKISESDVVGKEDVKIEIVDTEDVAAVKVERRKETPIYNRLTVNARDVLPPSTVCTWGAELLTALESLHNSGVICRDLNPRNILLGERGQIIVTYFVGYRGPEVALAHIRPRHYPHDVDLYVAPELYEVGRVEVGGDEAGRVADYWSYGAVLYELLCGWPLSHYHRGVFTSHTILQLPDGLTVEEHSLLTQLLTYEPSERLGAGKDGIEEIKRHPYFKHIDWQYIYDSWIVPD